MTKQGIATERYAWVAAVVLLGGMCLNMNSKRRQAEDRLRQQAVANFNVTDLRQRAQAYKARADMEAGELEALKSKLAMFNTTIQMNNSNGPARTSWLTETDIRELKVHGLANPETDLAADLQQHPELIPVTGSLGGKMRFYDRAGIQILNSHWALAGFDDGHITGRALLKFRFVKHGRVQWQVVDSFVD